MQDDLWRDGRLQRQFAASLSQPRFNRYLIESRGDEFGALKLYSWNSRLSKELYIYLQAWEICLRNRLSEFLICRYGRAWPYDVGGLRRQLTRTDEDRLSQARERQERKRRMVPAPLPAIVSDLSAGFWVSQLSKSYEIAHVWRKNMPKILPNEPSLDRPTAWSICNEMLTLRNRIAHHEPIFHLPLDRGYDDLQRIVAALCPGTRAFAEAHSGFGPVWHAGP